MISISLQLLYTHQQVVRYAELAPVALALSVSVFALLSSVAVMYKILSCCVGPSCCC